MKALDAQTCSLRVETSLSPSTSDVANYFFVRLYGD